MLRRLAAIAFAVSRLSAQLPPSAPLAESDQREFRAEIDRLRKQLDSSPDKAAVSYQMARTFAAGKQWPETINWLQKIAAMNAGLDPSRDTLFTGLRGTNEFEEIMARVRAATPPVTHSSRAFEIQEGDLAPENLAYDPRGKHFYFGSMRKGKVIRCSSTGDCSNFAADLGTVLGLKVRRDSLWLLNNSEQESALLQFDLASARIVRKSVIAEAGHLFNDLAFSPNGGVYLSDTRAAGVWILKPRAPDLVGLPGRFQAANGIALSPDGRLLYVSTYPDGIRIVDLKTQITTAIARPSDLCLAAVDGLYFHHGSLIAVQNGPMSPRVVRLQLSRDLGTIERFDILERRNPLFDGVTTGVVVGNEFFYMSNIQDDKNSNFNPIVILKLPLP